jgi:protein TonB
MKSIRLLTLILPFLLAVCFGTQASDSTPLAALPLQLQLSPLTIRTESYCRVALRVQFDVDANGRVQNTQILESTTTPEFEHKVISIMKNEWRYEKGKPGKDHRIVVMIRPTRR